jgi:hypothetical protein
MKLTVYIWSILWFGSLFSACNNNTKPAANTPTERYGFKKINGYVRYNDRQRELQADLTFRTDSTKQIEGLVVLNDELMRFKKRPKVGLQYVYDKRGEPFQRTQTFAYVEKDGSQQELSITLPEFDSLRLLSDGISQSKGGLLGWQGAALNRQDGLVLIVTDANGQTFSINHNGLTKGTRYEIMPLHAQKMALGTAKIEALRKRTIIEQDGKKAQNAEDLSSEAKTTRLLTIEHYLLPISFEVKP